MKSVVIWKLAKGLGSLAMMIVTSVAVIAQQMPDEKFDSKVAKPAYASKHPVVVIDEAHQNFHTATGRYKPFADLLTSDGYKVTAGTKPFTAEALKGVDVLVISNAGAGGANEDSSPPAFTKDEIEVVHSWVSGGGSVLLIADHTPFGTAAENLALKFGVALGKGFVFDLKNSDRGATTLVFSKENGLLGNHAILRGRDSTEEISKVVAFTGESMNVPAGASVLLKLSPTAFESSTRDELQLALGGANGPTPENIAAHSRQVVNGAQGIAMSVGKGKLVLFGEAAMFSAQVIRVPGEAEERKMGMNVPGNDDRQLALNVLHWLSGVLK